MANVEEYTLKSLVDRANELREKTPVLQDTATLQTTGYVLYWPIVQSGYTAPTPTSSPSP